MKVKALGGFSGLFFLENHRSPAEINNASLKLVKLDESSGF
jgi:hypothetical protein